MPDGMVVKRKRFSLPFGLGLLAGLAFGFAAGLVYLSIHRTVTEDAWEEWDYPGATVGSSHSAGGGGGPFGASSSARGGMQRTSDPFDTVVRHYVGKMGLQGIGLGASGSISRGTATGVDNIMYMSDTTRADGQARRAQVQTFARRSAVGSVVVVITRAEGDDETHINMYWLPRQ